MEPLKFSLMTGWAGFFGGVLSGAVMGLLFHREDWLGGYGSRERRMVRLGHISFFGIGADQFVLRVVAGAARCACRCREVRFDFPAGGFGHDAILLFSLRLVETLQAFVFHSRVVRRGWHCGHPSLTIMNIGYIAMSGLRLVDAELLGLGLSFPAVARRAREIEALPSLGLLTLAGMSPPHIGAEYLEVRDISEVPDRFDAIALSTLSATSKEAYAMAARFRERGIPVILGGLHATLAPEEAAKHVDSVVIGEGEPVWPEVLRDLERGDLKPVYDARLKGPFDFRNAPMPRFMARKLIARKLLSR